MSSCLYCHQPLPEARDRRHAKTCSVAHGKLLRRRQWREANPRSSLNLNSTTTGAVHELVVAVDLLKKGYEVFRALSPGSSCDLAILRDGKLIRVEVTTGVKSPAGKIMHPSKSNPHDLLAVVIGGEIHYSNGR